jgi:hypothetical protein
VSGRVPGPLGFREVSTPTKSSTKSSKNFAMPEPWSSSTIIRVGVLDWKLAKGMPVTTDVEQGDLAVCPVAAVLAALTHTDVGQKFVDGLITEYRGPLVKTALSNDLMVKIVKPDEDPDDKPQVKELTSNRYFEVKLGTSIIEVHDTFYVRYTDGPNLAPVYMTSPNGVLWPSVIEQACAIHFHGYNELGNFKKHTANELWKLIVGIEPQGGFEVKDSTSDDTLRDAARNAPKIPTIAASKDKVVITLTPLHGYAVLGLQGKNIELYDPAKAKTISLSPDEFRSNFQVVLSGTPGGKG